MIPMVLTYFPVFFVSVYVDDIISFFMKRINHIYQNKSELYIQNKISPELLDHGLQRD